MTIDEAIKKIKSLCHYCDKFPQCVNTDPDCFKALEMAIKALEQTQWIPVSKKPPEESFDSIIGWDAYRERCVFVQYIDGYFHITGKDESFDIRAWMPLPPSYQGE